MLLRMKDEGKPWAEIREAWENLTGEKVGGSTLSGRYARIKANFVVFSKNDVSFPPSWLSVYPPSLFPLPILSLDQEPRLS